MAELCNCCPTGIARCYSDDDGVTASRANLNICEGGERAWFDSFTGAELTATEVGRLRACPPDTLDPCLLIDPSTVQWQAVAGQPQVFTKDLGQGFIITARRGAGNKPNMSVTRTSNCSVVDNTMLGLIPSNGCAGNNPSYPLNTPGVVEFTASLPWPEPWAIRVFDVDGNHDTNKHNGPNETIRPLWGAPASITGVDAAYARDKGAGQIGANQNPAGPLPQKDGLRFNLNYAGPLPPVLIFNWHGCCVGLDHALPSNC